MATAAFDTLQYAQRLIDTGVPRAQAEVMATAHIENTQALVSQQHLDDKLEATEARINARFDVMSARIDGRIESLEQRISSQFRFIAFTQAIIGGGVLIPLVNSWLL